MKNLFLLFTMLAPTISLFAQDIEYNWDTITFETKYQYLEIDTSGQNIWQIGNPQKIFFDSAYSATKAIVTDTINYYPINNKSFFDIKIGSFNYENAYPGDIFMEIEHKYDTDTLKDGGYITVSYDNGKTWMNIIKDTAYDYGLSPAWSEDQNNLYTLDDTLFNGEFGFSGNSGGWITTYFSWHYLPVKSALVIGDTMVIRFNFESDSIGSSKEGWMIDNVRLYSIDLGGGIKDIYNGRFRIYPNPMHEMTTIELNKSYSKIAVEILNISGQIIEQRTFSNKRIINFDKNNLQPGIYLLKIKAGSSLIGTSKLIIK